MNAYNCRWFNQKRNALLIHAITWTSLENTQSERSQLQMSYPKGAQSVAKRHSKATTSIETSASVNSLLAGSNLPQLSPNEWTHECPSHPQRYQHSYRPGPSQWETSSGNDNDFNSSQTEFELSVGPNAEPLSTLGSVSFIVQWCWQDIVPWGKQKKGLGTWYKHCTPSNWITTLLFTSSSHAFILHMILLISIGNPEPLSRRKSLKFSEER